MQNKFPQFSAVILSAGSSSRMGKPKALLGIDDDIFINRIIGNLAGFRLNDTIIMLGEHAGAIESALTDQTPVKRIINPEPDLGQLSSIKIALNHLEKSVKGVMIILVDHPLVIKETYRQIFSAAEKDPDRIILPHYNGRNGHPVYFGRKYFPALQSAPVDLGARYVVHHNRAEVLEVPVGDEGILIDIDDPETYRKFITGER